MPNLLMPQACNLVENEVQALNHRYPRSISKNCCGTLASYKDLCLPCLMKLGHIGKESLSWCLTLCFCVQYIFVDFKLLKQEPIIFSNEWYRRLQNLTFFPRVSHLATMAGNERPWEEVATTTTITSMVCFYGYLIDWVACSNKL